MPIVTALLCAGLLGAAPLYAATITIDSSADTSGGASCTLRNAIASANTNAAVGGCAAGAAGLDTIHFNIPGTGVHTIVLGAALPNILEPVNINGYTQPGSAPNSIPFAYPAGAAINAQPMIEIDGNGMGGGAGVFYVGSTASNSTIAGLAVGNYLGVAAFILYGKADIVGNFIGVRADGTTAFPNNTGVIVWPTGQGSVIGGNASSRNLIARRVRIAGSLNVTVTGNLIGTDKNGTTPMAGPLSSGGIVIESSGPNDINNNVIGVGSGFGIWLFGASNTSVASNLIGVGVGGAVLGNSVGVWINDIPGAGASGNTIEGNTIANSAGDGIRMVDITGLGAISGNSLEFNSIYGNGGPGINLEGALEASNTVTPNDANDADTGPNGLQNYPVITSAKTNAGGGIDIVFTLNGTPNGLFRITAYANPVCHASGHGEGRYDSGTLMAVATDASGNGGGTYTVPAPLPAGWSVGQVVALLARDTTTHDTSEFSGCATVTLLGAANQPPPPLLLVPTLSEWELALLAGLLGLFGLFGIRRGDWSAKS